MPSREQDTITDTLTKIKYLRKRSLPLSTKVIVVGVFRGRSEIGPRALGNRSILASPLIPGMKDHLNNKIKYREDFRPFAPVVLEEKAKLYFKLSKTSPYMLLVADVIEKHRKKLVGVTHVDGSARIQTINREQNDFVADVLIEFEKISNYPILINTSFNSASMPIVETPDDAVKTFDQAELDFIILGNYLVSKKPVTKKLSSNHYEAPKKL